MSSSSVVGVSRSVQVLVVNYNSAARLRALADALAAQGLAIRLRIWDNASTDPDTDKSLEDLARRSWVTVTRSRENLGFGEGINALAAQIEDESVDDVLWILNPDTLPTASCACELVSALEGREYDIVSPVITTGREADRIWFAGGSLDQRRVATKHLRFGAPLSAVPASPFDTTFMTGAAPAMKLAVWRRVGGFPEGYFLYWEDASFSAAAARQGLSMGIIPSAVLWHEAGGSTPGRGRSRTFYYWATKNRFRFGQEIGRSGLDMLLGRGVGETARYLARAILERRDRWGMFRAAVRGTCAGFTEALRSA